MEEIHRPDKFNRAMGRLFVGKIIFINGEHTPTYASIVREGYAPFQIERNPEFYEMSMLP